MRNPHEWIRRRPGAGPRPMLPGRYTAR